MPTLITLQQAKNHLRLSDWGESPNPEDDDLELKIDAAEAAVKTYIERSDDEDWADEIAAWTEITVPRDIKAAVFEMVSYLYRFRGDDVAQDQPKSEHGDLPQNVKMLLFRWRDPAVA